MIQNNQPPDVLNLNSFSSYAKDGLLYSGDEVLSPKTREDFLEAFARGGTYRASSTASRSCPARAPSSTTATCSPGPAWPPRRGPGTSSSRRPGGCRRWAAGRSATRCRSDPEEAQAEWSIWMWNNGGDWKAGRSVGDQQREERADALGSWPRSPTPTRSPRSIPARPTAPTAPSSSSRTARSGMVIGFSPLAAQLDAEGKVQLRRGPDADQRRDAGDARRRGLPDGLQEEGQPGGGHASSSTSTTSPSRSRGGSPPRASCR